MILIAVIMSHHAPDYGLRPGEHLLRQRLATQEALGGPQLQPELLPRPPGQRVEVLPLLLQEDALLRGREEERGVRGEVLEDVAHDGVPVRGDRVHRRGGQHHEGHAGRLDAPLLVRLRVPLHSNASISAMHRYNIAHRSFTNLQRDGHGQIPVRQLRGRRAT